MRKTIWLMALALAAGGACKKTESEKAATEVRKAQEAVENKREDVREEANELAKANREGKDPSDVTEEARDVAKQGKQLTDAERKLESARGQLQAVVKGRLASVDGKLATLDSRTDPVSKQLATDLRARREIVSNRVNAVDSIAITNWDAYEKDVEDNLKVLENDLDKALDTKEKPAKPVDPLPPMK